MIKLNNNSIWINAILTIVSITSLIMLFLQMKYLVLGRGVYFGYENTVIWDFLVSIFWIFWLIGCFGLVLNKNWSFLFLFPPSVLSIVVCLAAFQKAKYSTLDIQIMTYIGLTFSMILLIYINWPTVRKRNGFTRNSYIFGALFLLLFIFLFLIIDQKQLPPSS
jgi:hypothetical protein